MIFALALVFLAQTPAAAPRIEDVSERRVFEDAKRALEADESLLALHRGLRAYLSTDDELRQAEEAYDALMELSTLRERMEDFEEALIVDGDARADFGRCMARVKRDPALRETLDSIAAIETELLRDDPAIDMSFRHLRATPENAIPFLTEPERSRTWEPNPLGPLRRALRRDKTMQMRLREAWIALDALAGAREAVYPWWKRAYGGSMRGRFSRLEEELQRAPSMRRAWETREMAWAPKPEAAAWRDHVYARVRRDPQLGPIYFDYLHTLRTRPDIEKYTEDTFATKHGAPPAWPPQGTPPRLPAWQRPESIEKPVAPKGPAAPSAGEPGVPHPKAPTINRPAAPTRPVAPDRAQKPVSP